MPAHLRPQGGSARTTRAQGQQNIIKGRKSGSQSLVLLAALTAIYFAHNGWVVVVVTTMMSAHVHGGNCLGRSKQMIIRLQWSSPEGRALPSTSVAQKASRAACS